MIVEVDPDWQGIASFGFSGVVAGECPAIAQDAVKALDLPFRLGPVGRVRLCWIPSAAQASRQ